MKNIVIFAFAILSVYTLELPSYYHTTESIHANIDEIAQTCSNFITIEDSETDPSIQIIHLNSGKNYKAFFVFGEHARELISPEVGLSFLSDLCQNQDKHQKLLERYEMMLIVNANPISRKKVEEGVFCLRENENMVDLNRNYDIAWEYKKDDNIQISSGSKPFSEVETQIVKAAVENFRPDVFFSIHSGTLALYTPYAYQAKKGLYFYGNHSLKAELYEKEMENVLENIKNRYCYQCESGSAGEELGYFSPGSSLDYAYEKLGIGFSFAFEIYHSEINLRQDSFLQMQEESSKLIKKKSNQKRSCFMQTEEQDLNDPSCFGFFNPELEDDYKFYIQLWPQVFEDVLNQIYDLQQAKSP